MAKRREMMTFPVYDKEVVMVNVDAQLAQRVRDVYGTCEELPTLKMTVDAALHHMLHTMVNGDTIHTETDLATKELVLEESDSPAFKEAMHVKGKRK